MTTQLTFNLRPERRILTVSELTGKIRDLLGKNFSAILVQGEISNCREAQSGHIYCTLKDDRAQIRCVCFKSQLRFMKFRPEDGLHVTVRGSISVYEARGDYQLYIENIEPVGLGALQLAFEQLKKRLEAEGLFAPERKKALPLLPSRIGLVTSPRGAAVSDIIRILRRRFHNVHLTLYPVRVQGEGASTEIVRAIQYFDRHKLVDVLILARGGGSLEDLWPFNEEEVARAIAACLIPVISGVGHESDFTIADFVADVRASTPSAAAELVVQTRREFDKHVADLMQTMGNLVRYRLLEWSNKVYELENRRGFDRPLEMLRQMGQRVDATSSRLGHGLRSQLERARRRYSAAHLGVRSTDLYARLAFEHKRLNAVRLKLGSLDLLAKVTALRMGLESRTDRLAVGAERWLRHKRERLGRLQLQLEERSPQKVLERGYSIATDAAGNLLRDASQVALGDTIAVRLYRGRLTAKVGKKEEE
jgi:exodeoxyribonuclease VII large subunit